MIVIYVTIWQQPLMQLRQGRRWWFQALSMFSVLAKQSIFGCTDHLFLTFM